MSIISKEHTNIPLQFFLLGLGHVCVKHNKFQSTIFICIDLHINYNFMDVSCETK
jgi:hypothetical protein